MKNKIALLSCCLLTAGIFLSACQGPPGETGPAGDALRGDVGPAGTNGIGTDGDDGDDGDDGQDGLNKSCTVTTTGSGARISCTDGSVVNVANGANGAPGGNGFKITDVHGRAAMTAMHDEEAPRVNATITSASANVAGVVTINFTVKDKDNILIKDLTSVQANIAKLVPATLGETKWNRWVPYIYSSETVLADEVADTSINPNGTMNPAGTSSNKGSREDSGTLTNHGDGSYTYVMAVDLANASYPIGGAAISYDQSLIHRVSIMMGGHTGYTADAYFDFVPNGTYSSESRDIVATESCIACHGDRFAGHGGDRLTVENCVTCHNPDTVDAHSGNDVDMGTMIHKIHAGAELPSIINGGEYEIWGYKTNRHSWEHAEFPAVIENCTKCHQGGGADVDNWKTNPSRRYCGSCHDDVDFATGTNHPGGAHDNDSFCSACHQPTTGSSPIEAAHDWTDKTANHIPEFEIAITVSTPANSTYFVAGETPIVAVKLKYVGDPSWADPTAFSVGSAEGCWNGGGPGACTTSTDKALAARKFFVHGPFANRVPVLTTGARSAKVGTAEPYDLSASDAVLTVIVDNGTDIHTDDLTWNRATFSVPVSVGTGLPYPFANTAAAMATEVVGWLNANVDFAGRAIAYLDDTDSNKVAIRSRNLVTPHAIQLARSAVNTAIFGGDLSASLGSGSNDILTDPKATASAANKAIYYTLDAVDDLQPGTYAISVEIADRGRVSATDYWSPSVTTVTFQVGTASAEKRVANNCQSCHQGPDGRGFILDFARHYKKLGDNAIDQCAGCHDYQQPATTTGDPTPSDYFLSDWAGGQRGGFPINKRVHALHRGSSLNYPGETVAYPNYADVWANISFPRDIRECEACHADSTSSGSWKTEAARLPCMGCHDSSAASTHMSLMTQDPTPEAAFSGDEVETCKVCH